jgi:hypothetical protein
VGADTDSKMDPGRGILTGLPFFDLGNIDDRITVLHLTDAAKRGSGYGPDNGN